MYGDDSDGEPDAEDILGPIIEEFSIKEDVNIKNFEVIQQPPKSAPSSQQTKKLKG